MLIDQRQFAEAGPLLERAIAVVEGQRGKRVDDLVLFYWNLAIVRSNSARAAQAGRLYDHAAALARQTGHPKLGPVLTDAANSACEAGDTARGMTLLGEAAPLVAALQAAEPWRGAWLRSVRGFCLERAGLRAEGAVLIAQNSAAIAARWGPDTFVGAAARAHQSLPR
jgi:hypothetical protein